MADEGALMGQVLEDDDEITTEELCRHCRVEADTIKLLVQEGILDPLEKDMGQWRFTVASLRRVRTVVHLQRDLGVNLPGAALALDLLDQIFELRRGLLR